MLAIIKLYSILMIFRNVWFRSQEHKFCLDFLSAEKHTLKLIGMEPRLLNAVLWINCLLYKIVSIFFNYL